jgi:hypothetical protein
VDHDIDAHLIGPADQVIQVFQCGVESIAQAVNRLPRSAKIRKAERQMSKRLVAIGLYFR